MWKSNWDHATNLNFGEEFTNAQTPKKFIGIVNRYIQLHRSKKIERFQIFFHIEDQYQADAENWIGFATSRRVQELNLDFCQGTTKYVKGELEDRRENLIKLPTFLFGCNSLTRLNLSLCDFNPPKEFSGFSSLESLQLRQVNITDDTLKRVLSNCPLLECLALRECCGLNSIKILGSKLRSLKVVDCWYAYEIEIIAPLLQSFHFYGDLFYRYSFQNVYALVDAFVSSVSRLCVEPDLTLVNILSDISHSLLKVLTIWLGSLSVCIHAKLQIVYSCHPIPSRNYLLKTY